MNKVKIYDVCMLYNTVNLFYRYLLKNSNWVFIILYVICKERFIKDLLLRGFTSNCINISFNHL